MENRNRPVEIEWHPGTLSPLSFRAQSRWEGGAREGEWNEGGEGGWRLGRFLLQSRYFHFIFSVEIAEWVLK
jgi:hypothetical protein